MKQPNYRYMILATIDKDGKNVLVREIETDDGPMLIGKDSDNERLDYEGEDAWIDEQILFYVPDDYFGELSDVELKIYVEQSINQK